MQKLTLYILFLMPFLLISAERTDYEKSAYYEEVIATIPTAVEYFNAVGDYAPKDNFFQNGIISKLEKNPLYLADFTKLFRQRLNETDDATMLFLLDSIGENTDRFPRKYYHFQDIYRSRVTKPKDIFEYADYLYETVNLIFSSAFEKLSEEEMDVLLQYSNQEIYPLKRIAITAQTVAPILEKIDFENLYKAGFILHSGISVISREAGKLVYDNQKILTHNSKYGNMAIGTLSNDSYTDDYVFILEPSGDDIYNMPAQTQNSLFAMIDFIGNDLYYNSKSIMSPEFGVSVSYDLQGNDTYRSPQLLSVKFGYQFHYDLRGDDIYQANLRSCGYAMFGISLLKDGDGDDIYSAERYSLGSAGMNGCGVLFDMKGNDFYRSEDSGGMPSASQGFGYGTGECDGGIGFLYDKSGNDSYQIVDLGQGAAVYNGIGCLEDESGKDKYTGKSRVQGFANTNSYASLYDKEGDDEYITFSEVAGSASENWSLVLRRDIDGNDSYFSFNNSLFSFNESAYLMFDFMGDDLYLPCMDDKGKYSVGTGLFYDLSGLDSYANEFCRDDTLYTRGYYCTIIDTLSLHEEESIVAHVKSYDLPITEMQMEGILDQPNKMVAIARLTTLADSTEGKWELVRNLSTNEDELIRYALSDVFNKMNYTTENADILDSLCVDSSYRVSLKAMKIRDEIKREEIIER